MHNPTLLAKAGPGLGRGRRDCATIPIGVIRQRIKHLLTEAGLQRFLADGKEAAAVAK